MFLMCVIVLYPFCWMMISSFKSSGAVMSSPPRFFPKEPTLSNYVTVIEAKIFRNFFNTVMIASIRTVITVYTSALLGYIFAKFIFKGRETVFMCIIATMMVPWVVTIIPLYNIFNQLRLLNTYWALILTGMVSSYGIYLVRSFMYQIDSAMIESARIDGCGEFKIFNWIIIPLSVPVLSTLGIMTFLATWDDYLWPFLVLITESKLTLTIALAKLAFKHYTIDYGPIIAGSVISNVPVIIVYLILQRRIIEGISLGAVKG